MVTKTTRLAMTSSKNDGWPSPACVLNRVYKVGNIGLDPCSNIYSIVQAKKAISLPQDGLLVPWQGNGLVYVNPPYGRQIRKWTKKMIYEAALGAEIIALLPARVDTRWFQEDLFPGAVAICFWKGRLTFLGAPAPALFPSAVVYWGPNLHRFVAAFQDAGRIILP